MSSGVTPRLSPEAFATLARLVRRQSGRPVARACTGTPIDYGKSHAHLSTETTGCGLARRLSVPYVTEDGGSRYVTVCADDDAVHRWPRWLRPDSVTV